jgi:hypothetical protein
MFGVVISVEGDQSLQPSQINRNYRSSGKDKSSGYLLMTVVLVGLRAPKDDHDSLDVGVAILVIIISPIFALLRTAAL